MKSSTLIAVSAFAALALVGADLADARRLGGGRSLGAQRQSVAPPAATPAPTAPAAGATAPGAANSMMPARPGAASNPVMPAQPGAATAAARPGAAGAAAAPSGMSRWLGPIAGIAAGLGLAALLSHLGLSEEFASLLLLGLLVIGAVVVIRLFMARRGSPQTATAGATYRSPMTRGPGVDQPSRFEPVWGGSAAAASTNPAFPPGFKPEPFTQQAKLQFRRLQEAYDKGDRDALADVMTPAMFAEISRDLDNRGAHTPTDVVALDAEILEVVTEGREYVASVRFTGAMREDGASEAKPFVEIWNLTKPVDGSSGWQLAGIQQVEESLAGR